MKILYSLNRRGVDALRLLILLPVLLVASHSIALATVYYVTPSGNDSNSGTSWSQAKLTVMGAINAASVGDQVWVKEGTYTSNTTITLKAGVQVYGGFNGTETSLSQRNWVTNVTILDGSKSCTVVTASSNIGLTTAIDGLTIQHGSGNNGGGMYCSGSPTIANCIFINNNPAGLGGGLYNTGSPSITNCTFTGNTSVYYTNDAGGGIYNSGTPTLTNCTITNNSAYYEGGGIYNSGTLNLSGFTITGNNCQEGAALFNDGGYMTLSDCDLSSSTGGPSVVNNSGSLNITSCKINGCPVGIINNGTFTITSSTIDNNKGYAIYNYNSIMLSASDISSNGGGIANTGSMSVTGCNILNNTGGTYGGGIDSNTSGKVTITDCLIKGNSATNGGGIYCNSTSTSSPARIADNLIVWNSVGGDGGGILCNGYATISNNTIANNGAGSGSKGGGVSLTSTTANSIAIANNIVAFNSSGLLDNGTGQTLSHSDVYGNTGFNYSGISPGTGDITQDPQFVNESAQDYHIPSTSPCVDAGDDSYVQSGDTDLDGNPRKYGAHVDIGCYEYTPSGGPSISSLSPSSTPACGPSFTLTVNGGNFVSGSTVDWNGTALTTTYASSTQLTASVPAADIASPCTASITAVNPDGTVSNAVTFTITNPVPVLSGIKPTSVDAAGPGFTLTITGKCFISSSVVYWGSTALTTTFVSATKLTATVPSSLFANPGSAKITVVTPSPGGGTSTYKTIKILQTSLSLTVSSLTKNSDGSFTAGINLKNTGYLAANSLQISGSTLGAAATSTALPVSLGNLAAGSSVSTTLNYPSIAGTSGTYVSLKVATKFTGGTSTFSIKVKLP